MKAYRSIEIYIDDLEQVIEVPFTVELMRRVEEVNEKLQKAEWFVMGWRAKRITDAFEDFAKPYFPKDFDFSKTQPTFTAFFFKNVRDQLHDSIRKWADSMKSTDVFEEPTEDKSYSNH